MRSKHFSRVFSLVLCLFLLFVNSSDSDPENIENLNIETVAANGKYHTNISFTLPYPVRPCRKVIENFSRFPRWLFKGINDLNTSRFYWLRQENLHSVSREGKDSLLFDYDMRIFLFHFTGTLEIVVNKTIYQNRMEGKVQGRTEKANILFKKISGGVELKESEERKTSLHGEITIHPKALLYNILPTDLVGRVIASRLKKIAKNLNHEISRNLLTPLPATKSPA